MKCTAEQARVVINLLGDLMEVLSECDDPPELVISRLEAVLDDLAIKIGV